MTYATKNVTFRCYELHHGVVLRAAEKAGKSLSDYCRDIVIPWAASDLGERLPPLPKLEQGRRVAMVAEAARLIRLTPEQFGAKAAAQAATVVVAGQTGVDEGHLVRIAEALGLSLVEQAAKLQGVPLEQFERKAAEQAAARALDLLGPDDVGSGEHEAQRPGSYVGELRPAERMRRVGGKR